ncbi:hypothetical protein ADL06_28195 [Streptomyces sp. NRRL F-6491]|nr:hypothetical protein ADL06_28195 [Streptomyces sp. NRRL F-6491]KOX37956.1 hypothetical protein ADL08_28160 [Streptomyces sp. NRRL F-6492]
MGRSPRPEATAPFREDRTVSDCPQSTAGGHRSVSPTGRAPSADGRRPHGRPYPVVRPVGRSGPCPDATRPRAPPGVVGLEPGPLLGVGPDAARPLTVLPLRPGTTLALHTDGLVEIPRTDPERTADDLAHLLAEHDGQPLDHLMDLVLRRARPTALHTDDIALLLLRTAVPPA